MQRLGCVLGCGEQSTQVICHSQGELTQLQAQLGTPGELGEIPKHPSLSGVTRHWVLLTAEIPAGQSCPRGKRKAALFSISIFKPVFL